MQKLKYLPFKCAEEKYSIILWLVAFVVCCIVWSLTKQGKHFRSVLKSSLFIVLISESHLNVYQF